jgi:predicted transposase/invertase (TIGR01784 family)
MERGIEKGMERGIEKGIERVAANMINEGLPYETIVKATGIPMEKLLTLH